MVHSIKYKKGRIFPESKQIVIDAYYDESNVVQININVADDNNDEYILRLIDMANVHYSTHINKINGSDNIGTYGCLTSKVLGLYDIPNTFINPKYVKNLFLKLSQLLFHDEKIYEEYWRRDEKSVEIPTSPANISTLISDITAIMSSNNNNNNDDEDIVDIKDAMLFILTQIIGNQRDIPKEKIMKQASICGGIHNINNIKDSLNTNINQTLSNTGETIHSIICDNQKILRDDYRIKEKVNFIKEAIVKNPQQCLYQNLDISFRFMMEMIQEVLNVLFIQILPQTSMLYCLYATLYQASVLNELKILKYYSKSIHIPIMYRLIYSCFKDNRQYNVNITNNDTISKLVNRLCNYNDNCLDIICDLAVRIDITNVDQLDLLYTLLNEKRGHTIEFYLIIITNVYIMGKCQGLNKTNKIANCKMFAQPLYNLLYLFYKFIVEDLKELQLALCSETFDKFNMLYSNDIKNCVKSLFQNLH